MPCIGLNVKDKFIKYEIEDKYKIITIRNAPSSLGERIIIVLNETDKIDIFKKLYEWIHQDLLDDCNLIRTFDDLCKYIDRYAELFKQKSDNSISKESIIGLYGELDLLNELLKSKRYEKYEVINSWSGYYRSTHDFNLLNMKLEVKTSMDDNTVINCSSYNQLLAKKGFQTYLINLSYTENTNKVDGKNIFEMIELVKSNLKNCSESLKKFQRKLEIFGIDRIKDNLKYSRISSKIFDINEDFPSFQGLKIHSSISDLKYKIDLSMCEKWLTPLNMDEL